MSTGGNRKKASIAYACNSWLDAFIFTIENYGKTEYKIEKSSIERKDYDESKT